MLRQDYNSRFGISQSALKDFKFKSPKRWKEIWIDKQLDLNKNEDSFTFGSLVDILLFSPELLDEKFYIGRVDKLPSDAIKSIIKSTYDQIINFNQVRLVINENLPEDIEERQSDLTTNRDLLLECINNYEYIKDNITHKGWNSGWKDDTRVNKLIDEGNDYFNLLVQSNDRKIITQGMNMKAIEIVNILRNDSEVKDFFIKNEENELIFQLEIFVDYILQDGAKVPIKGALDIVRFDHKYQTVQLCDFKTGYSAYEFLINIKKYGYCDQSSFYDYLLREWLVTYCEGKYCNYKIINPINIVIDSDEKVPYIYEYDWKDIELVRDGNKGLLYDLFQTHDHNQRIKRGWKEILEEIAFHYSLNYWEKPKELYLNKKIKVNLS